MDRNERDIYELDSLDNFELVDSDQDLRGETLITPDGREIAEVDDMLVNTNTKRVAALRLSDDRIVDIDYVEIRDDKPVLMVPHERIPRPGPDFDRENITSRHIPIIEERLEVGKRPVETGKLEIHTRTVSEPVSKQVELQNERVSVERRPVDEPIAAGDAKAMFRDQDVEITERGEKAVVGKEARVKEELVVNKETDTRTEEVKGNVRHTEVDVDRTPKDRR